MVVAAFLPAIDRGGFAVALATRLREHGIDVGMTAIGDFVRALSVAPPGSSALLPSRRGELYWLARITLVSAQHEVEVFDAVFEAVFDDAVLALDPTVRRTPDPGLPPSAGRPADPRRAAGSETSEATSPLPWVTRRHVQLADAPADTDRGLAEPLPSTTARLAEVPFGDLAPDELTRLVAWLHRTAPQWPTRRHRRTSPAAHGRRVALRRTLARARRTGLEPVELVREGPTRRPRRVVMVCDVSQSMQTTTTAHLHLMRMFAALRQAEVFAFSTSLTRLTPALREHHPERAVARAGALVSDRFGGTRIAGALSTLLDSRHGGLLRGAVVVIVSDGWDGDPPEALAAAMARLARRADTVVWLNPRAAAPGFSPTVGAMAAALPYCDLLLPAGTFGSLAAALRAIAGLSSTR